MGVAELILSRLGPTLLLMLTVFVLSVGFGVLLGAIAARNLNRWRDNLISMSGRARLRHAAFSGPA